MEAKGCASSTATLRSPPYHMQMCESWEIKMDRRTAGSLVLLVILENTVPWMEGGLHDEPKPSNPKTSIGARGVRAAQADHASYFWPHPESLRDSNTTVYRVPRTSYRASE